jgi:hypothetical protein
MRSIAMRSAFAATLCAGVGMVGVSVLGLVGVDGELQRSAVAAKQQPTIDSIRVSATTRDRGDCPGGPPARNKV